MTMKRLTIEKGEMEKLREKKTSKIMLTLLLISILALALDSLLVKANPVTTFQQNDNPNASLDAVGALQSYSMRRDVLTAPDLKDVVRSLRGYSPQFREEYSLSSGLSPLGIGPYGLDLGSSSQWADFAAIDKDSVELVIGVNNAWQSNHNEVHLRARYTH